MYVSYSEWMDSPRQLPDDVAVFAIGDVHGQAAELSALHQVLRQQIASSPELNHHVVHVGDYIDRGTESRETLEILANGLGTSAEEIYLVGNHDQYLIELIRPGADLDREFIVNWYENGGIATMKSLGVSGYGRLLDNGKLDELAARTRKALSPTLLRFLSSLQDMHRIGDYVFVHAGIDPSRDLDDQDFPDLVLIREPFLSSAESWRHSFCVIHGHSIAAPAVHPHRIGVDAGCFATGALCAVELKASSVRFIAVTGTKHCNWLRRLRGPAINWQWSAPEPIDGQLDGLRTPAVALETTIWR